MSHGDTLIVYWSGLACESNGDSYLLAEDSDVGRLASTAVTSDDLTRSLRGFRGAQILLMLDIHSVDTRDASKAPVLAASTVAAVTSALSNAIAETNIVASIVFACATGERTQDDAARGLGLFCSGLVDMLADASSASTQEVSASEIVRRWRGAADRWRTIDRESVPTPILCAASPGEVHIAMPLVLDRARRHDVTLVRQVGSLSVSANCDSMAVVINNYQIGTVHAPWPVRLVVPIGAMSSTGSHAGRTPATERIEVAFGEQESVHLNLVSFPALKIRLAQPDTLVELDGEVIGSGGPDCPIDVASIEPGTHSIRGFKPGLLSSAREFLVQPGVDAVELLSLDAPGAVVVGVDKGPATVLIDGVSVGRTGMGVGVMVGSLEPGERRVDISGPGIAVSFLVSVRSGGCEVVSVAGSGSDVRVTLGADVPGSVRHIGEHIVGDGETIDSIARGYCMTVSELVRLNAWLEAGRAVVGTALSVYSLANLVSPGIVRKDGLAVVQPAGEDALGSGPVGSSAKKVASVRPEVRRAFNVKGAVGRLGVVIHDGAFIFRQCDTKSSVLYVCPGGTRLCLRSQLGVFYSVLMIDGSVGFIHSETVRLTNTDLVQKGTRR
ncbi:MAG: LysM peptidoglycan-binding domain-containing protein [Fimbriimonadaceae bacterium]|nr:LysM peptidoglycan-binding domain-containing protein [Fimbriimonadaceae bacterium]